MDRGIDALAEIAYRFADNPLSLQARDVRGPQHPFEERNIHPEISEASRNLFDNGHFSQATFEACKVVEDEVQKLSTSSNYGSKLMTEVFDANNPLIKLNELKTNQQLNEQKGFRCIFAGVSTAIRNPKAHGVSIPETVDECLDNLSLTSLLMRKLDNAG